MMRYTVIVDKTQYDLKIYKNYIILKNKHIERIIAFKHIKNLFVQKDIKITFIEKPTLDRILRIKRFASLLEVANEKI